MNSLVLFGAGIEGEKFLRHFWNDISFKYVMDNKKKGLFYNLIIKEPKYEENIFIIVTSYRYYFEIRKQLIELGYREFIDFIPMSLYKKKMAVAYGNCHMGLVKMYLERHKEFSADYGFYPLPEIQMLGDDFPLKDILPFTKLLLHQSVREDNRFGYEFSSNNIIAMMPQDCIIISCPNLYGLPKCFFPQLELFEDKINMFSLFCSYKEKNIEYLVRAGVSKEIIKNKLQSGGVYTKNEIVLLWEEFKNKLVTREKQWDIKISDYIFEKYKTEKLFNDTWHITTKLGREISNRIIKYMGYHNFEIPIIIPSSDYNEVFIYQDVKDALGLEFEEKTIRNYSRNVSYTNADMDLDGYVDELYQYICMYLDMGQGEGKKCE